ncbi:MAG: hypothetical protein R6X02_17770 [Enhygromyxa sp.]
MKAWIDLYSSHREVRALANAKWTSDIRKRLIKLSEAGHCDPSVQGRFSYKKSESDLLKWSIMGQGETPPIALTNLPDLAVADLAVMALASRDHHLHEFTVMVEGLRQDESPWALAVHLPDDRDTIPGGDRQGLGACGHAALHCHVGPNLAIAPKVRVPLPPLGPAEILDWVISQILPNNDFEPAPWAEVESALEQATQ